MACLSLAVSLVQLVCCFVVRSSPPTRGCSGAQRLFQVVMVAAGSAWGLALSHAGVPVHVWRCRRPFPYGGLDPLRRETSAATVAIHALGGRCSTRPCAHAIGPSSFSAVRRQVATLSSDAARPPVGGSAVRAVAAHLCRSLLRQLSGVRLARSGGLGCIAVPSHLYSSDACLPSFCLIVSGCLWLVRSLFISFVCVDSPSFLLRLIL